MNYCYGPMNPMSLTNKKGKKTPFLEIKANPNPTPCGYQSLL